MKKHLLGLAVLVMITAFSFSIVGAQDEEAVEALPSCSPEDYVANVEAIGEAFTGLGELTTLPEAPTASDYAASVAILDAFAVGYWEGFDPEAIACAEELYIGQTAGIIFDELVIVNALSALAAHEETAGNTEYAELLLEQATARGEILQAELEDFGATLTSLIDGEEVELDVAYPACTEEELTATSEGLTTINETYAEFGAALGEGLTGTDLTDLVTGFAALSQGYWDEFFTVLPACFEAQSLGYEYGLLLDESLITVSLLRLAELEAEAGNAELAQVLADSALAHVETLTEMSEALLGESEEE